MSQLYLGLSGVIAPYVSWARLHLKHAYQRRRTTLAFASGNYYYYFYYYYYYYYYHYYYYYYYYYYYCWSGSYRDHLAGVS